jgi:acetolactate synthase regulatory subunit
VGAMRVSKIYRIYTEQKNKREIISLAVRRFDSFTIQPTMGYYRTKAEKSIVLEIVGASERDVSQLALHIKKMNGQKSILITKTQAQARTIRM